MIQYQEPKLPGSILHFGKHGLEQKCSYFLLEPTEPPHFTSGTNENRSMQIHTRVRTHAAVTHTRAHTHMAEEACQAITLALSLCEVLQCALSHSAVSFFKC